MQSVLFLKTDIPRTCLLNLNGIFTPFDSLNSEFSPGFRLIDNFTSYFFFYWANYKDKESKIAHFCKLDDIFSNISLDSKSIIVIVDTSIRNNIAISIFHIYSSLDNIRKTIHYVVNITSTKAKLFAIKYSINQAIQIPEATHIIVITNAIHIAEHIFNSTIYPY